MVEKSPFLREPCVKTLHEIVNKTFTQNPGQMMIVIIINEKNDFTKCRFEYLENIIRAVIYKRYVLTHAVIPCTVYFLNMNQTSIAQ